MFANSNEHLGDVVYVCERRHHAILSVDGRLGHRAAVSTAGFEAALQTLGIPDRADSLRRRAFMDRVGVDHRKAERLPNRPRYRLPRYSCLFDMAETGSNRGSQNSVVRSLNQVRYGAELVNSGFCPLYY